MRRSKVMLVFAAAGALVCQAPPTAAQAPEEPAQVSFHIGAPAGIRRLRPATWGLVGVRVANPGDEPAEVLATLYFGDEANLQYGRRLWVPAHSTRYSWCPVFPPPSAPPESPSGREVLAKAEVRSLLYDVSSAREAVVRSRSERVLASGLVPIHHSRMVTAVICDSGADDEAGATDPSVFEMVVAAKVSAGHSDAYADLFEDFLPPVLESLDGLDRLVLASDRLASDPAALAAVRRWLIRGGHLWVLLDQVDPATVEFLLGDGAQLRVVDRVGLTEVEIEPIGSGAEASAGEPRPFDKPVDLVRVVATGVEVTHRVNGWPVAFWQPMGKGTVLATALGPRAWIRPRTASDPRPAQAFDVPRLVATRPLDELAARFFEPQPSALEPAGLAPYLSERIGYRIVGRESVVAVLGGFCLVLLGSGLWLARKKRLERMAWVAPLAAALAAAVLVTLGHSARNTVPPMVAVAQLAQVDPGVDDVHVSGLMAIYQQEAAACPLGARRGGIFFPDMTGLEGTTRRMVRTDLDVWRWEHLVLPAGVRAAPFTYATSVETRVEARAAFGPNGLRGTVRSGPFRQMADAVIGVPWQGRLAAKLDEDGTFTAGPGDVLAPGQFITEAMLSDEQRRRQAVYEQVFSGAGARGPLERPTLFAWARPLDMHLRLPDDFSQVGAALVAIPLEIERTPPGSRVVIPSAWLDFRSISGPEAKPSAAYSNPVREWIEMRTPSTVCLRFQIPHEVLPIALERASLALRIHAPSRKMEVLGFRGREAIVLETRESPVGTFKFNVARRDVLELDGGGLLLAFGIDRDQAASVERGLILPTGSAWKIESVALEVAGTTLLPRQ